MVDRHMQQVLIRLSAIRHFYSPNVHFFSQQTVESVGLFLKSCNITLMKEACSALELQHPESQNAFSFPKRCLWGKLDAFAGLGHQMTEILFFARMAHVYMLPHVFEIFSQTNSKHDSSYHWASSFFGLERTFQNLGSSFAKSESNLIDETSSSCDHFLRLNSGQCDNSMSLAAEDMIKSSDNCFQSPIMHMLFATFAPCFRQSSLCHGSWVAEAKSVQYDPAVVNVAWHIRVGDKDLYNSSSSYYR
jgi:hypothetical protein